MSIKDTYLGNKIVVNMTGDYYVYKVNDDIYIGEDKASNLVLLIRSINENEDPISQRTNTISLITNSYVKYGIEGNDKEGIFHVLTCYAKESDEREIFLELCDAYFLTQKLTTEKLWEIFMTLMDFFSERKVPSYIELEGLYAELYTIYYFEKKYDLAKCWQSKDNLKFDFSISSKIKLEIKSTLKQNRAHRFSHEQLATKIYDVYILSYKFIYDDMGLDLSELIEKCKPLLKKYPDKLKRLIKVKYESEKEDLEKHKYSEEYIQNKMKLYSAKEVPHFDDKEGVSGATYESDFENINDINIDDFIDQINNL